LILLDLNMPRKDGREALEEIRADDALSHIPVIVLTTSQADEDIAKTYKLGANSFISKPSSFDELVAITDALKQYWLGLVRLPDANVVIMKNKVNTKDVKTSHHD
jgi:CheY-like chemotaxis protein